MTNKCTPTIFVATDGDLINSVYITRLWIAARNMPYSRRKWLDVIADSIYEFEGNILLPSGMPYEIPEVDEVIGNDRWISLYLEEINGKPRRNVRLKERLRMFDLYFRIKHPNIQQHFGR